MNKKYLITAFVFAFAACFSLFGAAIYRQHYDASLVRGHYALEKIRSEIPLISYISVQPYEAEAFNLYRKGDYWHFKEAADYFVNNKTLADFYDFINNGTITDIKEASPEKIAEIKQGAKIEIFDVEKKPLTAFWLAKQPDSDGIRAMLPEKSPYIYLVSRARSPFQDAEAWIPMPLLQIKSDDIVGIDFGSQYIDGITLDSAKQEFDFVKDLMKTLNYTLYDSIITKQSFFKDYPEIKGNFLKIHIFGGLVYKLDVYIIDDTYWLGVSVSTEHIARKPAVALAQSLQMFYADWLFQLNPQQGKIIAHAAQK